MCEIEVWVVVDANGDYGVGKDSDLAFTNYRDDIGEPDGATRLVKVLLKVPTPKPVELVGVVPEEVTEGAELRVA